ncbi:hypothetical protein C2845_PM05G26600 [Panicum miliaceum]|uniref:Uncharacterized protein n=1 Tax=Panicum miliaceum TaxID=4540 RepID=A0A3L6SVB0_PANMI|nr:hypothetical protein C2845_PM05G26600 [Panicum miliaceum]
MRATEVGPTTSSPGAHNLPPVLPRNEVCWGSQTARQEFLVTWCSHLPCHLFVFLASDSLCPPQPQPFHPRAPPRSANHGTTSDQKCRAAEKRERVRMEMGTTSIQQ